MTAHWERAFDKAAKSSTLDSRWLASLRRLGRGYATKALHACEWLRIESPDALQDPAAQERLRKMKGVGAETRLRILFAAGVGETRICHACGAVRKARDTQ